MLYRILVIVLVLCTSVAFPESSHAQKSPAAVKQMLQARDAEIKRILGDRDTFTEAQRETLKKVINDVIDFEEMGRAALGPHWQRLSEEQRTSYVEVFGDIIRSQSLSNLDVYRSPVDYADIVVRGDSAHVVTSTIFKDVPTRVEYDMLWHGGAWHVSDIVLDDVSTTAGYARSFQAVVRKKGFDALMASLEKRRAKDLGQS